MGRYYNTDYGRDGKFGVGCQPSADPGDFFGMEEFPPSQITYYTEDDEMIKKKLDELYDELKVPQDERVYYLKKDTDDESKFYDNMHKYVYREVNRREVGRYDKIEGFNHNIYSAGSACGKHKVLIETQKNANLCLCRLKLGLTIISDIKDTGRCELYAEM